MPAGDGLGASVPRSPSRGAADTDIGRGQPTRLGSIGTRGEAAAHEPDDDEEDRARDPPAATDATNAGAATTGLLGPIRPASPVRSPIRPAGAARGGDPHGSPRRVVAAVAVVRGAAARRDRVEPAAWAAERPEPVARPAEHPEWATLVVLPPPAAWAAGSPEAGRQWDGRGAVPRAAKEPEAPVGQPPARPIRAPTARVAGVAGVAVAVAGVAGGGGGGGGGGTTGGGGGASKRGGAAGGLTGAGGDVGAGGAAHGAGAAGRGGWRVDRPGNVFVGRGILVFLLLWLWRYEAVEETLFRRLDRDNREHHVDRLHGRLGCVGHDRPGLCRRGAGRSNDSGAGAHDAGAGADHARSGPRLHGAGISRPVLRSGVGCGGRAGRLGSAGARAL